MTIEEAIKTFKGRKALAFADGYADQAQDYIDAMNMAIAALREKRERENPRPLTVEELRKMDRQPVWINYLPYKYGHWMVFQGERDRKRHGRKAMGFQAGLFEYTDDYGKTWLAYRYPPEHIADDGKTTPCFPGQSAHGGDGHA